MLHTIRTWIAHHAPGRWRTLYLSDAKAFITNLEDDESPFGPTGLIVGKPSQSSKRHGPATHPLHD